MPIWGIREPDPAPVAAAVARCVASCGRFARRPKLPARRPGHLMPVFCDDFAVQRWVRTGASRRCRARQACQLMAHGGGKPFYKEILAHTSPNAQGFQI